MKTECNKYKIDNCNKCTQFDYWIGKLNSPLSDNDRSLLQIDLIKLKQDHKEGLASIPH